MMATKIQTIMNARKARSRSTVPAFMATTMIAILAAPCLLLPSSLTVFIVVEAAFRFPPSSQRPALPKFDPYRVLGIPPTTTTATTPSQQIATIKAAYRQRAKETHPDQGGSNADFIQVQEAYEWLTDPVKRRRLDHHRQSQQRQQRQRQRQQQQRQHQSKEQFRFSSMSSGSGQQQQKQRQRQQQKPSQARPKSKPTAKHKQHQNKPLNNDRKAHSQQQQQGRPKSSSKENRSDDEKEQLRKELQQDRSFQRLKAKLHQWQKISYKKKYTLEGLQRLVLDPTTQRLKYNLYLVFCSSTKKQKKVQQRKDDNDDDDMLLFPHPFHGITDSGIPWNVMDDVVVNKASGTDDNDSDGLVLTLQILYNEKVSLDPHMDINLLEFFKVHHNVPRHEVRAGRPHVVFAHKGERLDHFRIYRPEEQLKTSSATKKNRSKKQKSKQPAWKQFSLLQEWIQQQLQVPKLKLINEHSHPVTLYRLVRRRDDKTKPSSSNKDHLQYELVMLHEHVSPGATVTLGRQRHANDKLHVGDVIVARDDRVDAIFDQQQQRLEAKDRQRRHRRGKHPKNVVYTANSILFRYVVAGSARSGKPVIIDDDTNVCFDLTTRCDVLQRDPLLNCRSHPEFMHSMCSMTCGKCQDPGHRRHGHNKFKRRGVFVILGTTIRRIWYQMQSWQQDVVYTVVSRWQSYIQALDEILMYREDALLVWVLMAFGVGLFVSLLADLRVAFWGAIFPLAFFSLVAWRRFQNALPFASLQRLRLLIDTTFMFHHHRYVIWSFMLLFYALGVVITLTIDAIIQLNMSEPEKTPARSKPVPPIPRMVTLFDPGANMSGPSVFNRLNHLKKD